VGYGPAFKADPVDERSARRGIMRTRPANRMKRVDFGRIGCAAKGALPSLLRRWLPDGKQQGSEWVAINPRRNDRRLGSFKINILTGCWADFATGDKGGDAISLAAYLFGISQVEAARRIADMFGLEIKGRSRG
jgi:hypothetical protein